MRRLANAGLTVLLLGLVIVALAVAIVPGVTRTQAVTIDANSMQRVLPMGSLVYIAPQTAYTVGDIVTFRNQAGNTVTHQIVALEPNPATNIQDGSLYRTQGSENALPDDNPVRQDAIVGRVVYSIPVVGIGLKVVGTPVVEAFLALMAIGLYLLSRPSAEATSRARTKRRLQEMSQQ